MTKRLIAFFLAVMLLFSYINVLSLSVSAAYDVSALVALCKQYPDGKYWNHIGSAVNNPEGYTSVPCTHHKNGAGCSYARPAACECNYYNQAIQCMGYAYMIAEKIVGSNPRSWQKIKTLNTADLRVGDVIRYYNDTHSITVTGVSGNKISYTGANWGGDCLIKWDTMDKSEITGFSYVLHAKSNKITNKNLTFYEGVVAESDIRMNSGEVWQMNDEGSLNVREDHSTSAKKTGTIAAKGTFFVFDKFDDGKYLWAKVDDGITKGWAVLNYSTYKSGVTDILTVEETSVYTAGREFALKWNAIPGAEKYSISVYKADGTSVKNLEANTNTITLSLPDAGIYVFVVSCSNSKASSWKMQSQRKELTVVPAPAFEIQSITLPAEAEAFAGEFSKLTATVYPAVSKDAVAWRSSDESVVSVLIDGTILAHKEGTAYVYCSSLTDERINSVCKVTVKLSVPSGFAQIAEKSTRDTVSLKWNEVKGADGYRVYMIKSNGKYKLIADTAETTALHSGRLPGKTYFYNVRAYSLKDGVKSYSPFSGEIYAATATERVQNFRVTDINAKSFRLSWDEVEGADYYALYKYNEVTGVFDRVNSFKKTSVKIKKPSGSITAYKIAAVKRHGSKKLYGELSDAQYGITTPKKPVVKSEVKEGKATLSWKKTEGATGYIIYKKTDEGYKKVKVVNGKKTKYTFKKLKKGNTYTYKVRASMRVADTVYYSNYSSPVKVEM